MAKKLRAEKEKNREFQSQKEDQKSYLNHLEARRQRLIHQLMEMRQNKANASGQSMMQRAEDAIRVNQYMINEKLNKETQQTTASIALMEKVLAAPNPNSADLQLVVQKVKKLKKNDFLKGSLSENLFMLSSRTMNSGVKLLS
jgi:hypothetical protein